MPRLKPPPSQPTQIEEDLFPIEDDVVIDLNEGDLNAIEVVATPEDEPSPQPLVAEPVEPEPDALKLALDAQKRAEDLARDMQRQRDDAMRQAQERAAELRRATSDREDAEYNTVLTAIAAEQTAIEKAEADLQAAASAGDWVAHSKAQREMALASARYDRLDEGKRSFDQRREALKTAPPQPQSLGFEQQLANLNLPVDAQTWLRAHPEFINDKGRNDQLGTTHVYLTNVKNISAFSKAYFDELDQAFGFKKAGPSAAPTSHQPIVTNPQPQPRRSIPVAAPVSREPPTSSGQRASSSQVHLTREEREIARNSFGPVNGKDLTNAEKERLYAINKAKLARMKANGTYTETRQ